MFWFWMILCLFVSSLLEIIVQLNFFAAPIFISIAFYFACLLPFHKAFLPLIITAGLLDCYFARVFPCTVLSLLLFFYFAQLWKYYGNQYSFFTFILPGFVNALVYGIFLHFNALLLGGKITWLSLFLLLRYAFLGLIILPLIVLFLERAAKYFALRRLETRVFSHSSKTQLLTEDYADE